MRTRRVPVVLQFESGECGVACIAMLLSYYGRPTSLAQCRAFLPTGTDGATVRALTDAGRTVGFHAEGLSVDLHAFKTLPMPVIAHWRFNHFVVIEKWSTSEVTIIDPTRGRAKITYGEFSEAFTGIVVRLRPTQDHRQTLWSDELRLRRYLENRRARKHLALMRQRVVSPAHCQVPQRERLSGAIELRDVSLDLDGAPDVARIWLKIAAGSKLAIVGCRGSGKSTLLKVLLGLHRSTGGQVLYDGRAIECYERDFFRSHFGVVLQSSTLALRTTASDAAVIDGDQTIPIGVTGRVAAEPREHQRAIMLGHRSAAPQRLALGRALARKPKFLVLDDAASQVDAGMEQSIDHHLASRGCTRILVAPRLSTLRDANQIVVLDGGMIIEEGTHADLVDRRGQYWELIRGQLEEGRDRGPL